MKPQKIVFLPENKAVEFTDEESVLDVALKNHIPIAHSCGGMGSCTTCRVFVESDLSQTSPRTEMEQEMAESRGFTEDERLSCQLQPHDGLRVRRPDQRT